MKKLVYFSVAFFALSFLACQDDRDEVKNTADVSYFRNAGMQIPTETGYRWMDLYRTKQHLSGRVKPSGYALSKEHLAELSNSVDELVAVAFHHAVDDAGQHHFLIIPLDETLKLWSNDKAVFDANENVVITADVAHEWTQNYQNANPDGIWFHVFGKHVVDEISAIPFFEYIQIEPAINDANLLPQVLLIVNDLSLDASSGGREQAQAFVFDGSVLCPCDNVGAEF
jgi:hypothetical protein